RLALVAAAVFLHQFRVRKLRLGIFVEILHVGVRRRTVEIEEIFLHVLAVVALIARQTEQTFFKNWITLIPQCEGKTNDLPAIADSGYAVFVPAIGAGTG